MTSGPDGDVDMDIGNNERRMLRAMLSDPSKEWTLGQLLSETGWEDQVHVAGAGKKLELEGLVELSESTYRMVSLGDEGQRASEIGLLESCLLYTSPSPRDSV